MLTIGTYEAKTNLPRLIERVEAGEIVTITRHGKPVARLVPVGLSAEEREKARKAADGLRKLRKSVKRGGPTIRELIRSGRKF
jgi:prevent-host-death family protein